MGDPAEGRWLLLIHQIPPKPDYFRVKIRRRLHRIGSVAIKNSVYVLPSSDETREDFQWVLREIVDGGGEATLCEASFVDGLSDEQVEALFHAARDADYREIVDDARRLSHARAPADRIQDGRGPSLEGELARLRRRLAEVTAIDFFAAPSRGEAEQAVAQLEARIRAARRRPPAPDARRSAAGTSRGRTWVTRKGIHVDRMASAWLIRRFIDPEARFKFVPAKGYRPAAGEARFDMFNAEFTHEGDHCTFETLIERFGLDDPALRAIAEVVHDIDLKDEKFGRKETLGIQSLIAGIVVAHRDDQTRLERGCAVFDDLYEFFKRR